MNRKQALLTVCTVLLATSTIFAQAPAIFLQAPAAPNLIYVSVEVFRDGKMPVTGLKKENFNLQEDRTAQTILFLQEGNPPGIYILGYSPTNSVKDGSWRSFRVSLSDPSGGLGQVTVRAKQGYYAR